MSEENKDVKSDNNQAEETPKREAPKAEEPKKAAPKQEEKKKEKPVNCAVCNKSIRKKRYYYRNGKYFCTKRCFKTTIKKENADKKEKTA